MVEKVGQLQALILGSTGAVGRELVRELCTSDQWSQITLIVRRELPQWQEMPNYNKLKIVKVESLDSLQDKKNWKFDNINTFFCLLGGRTKQGKEEFTKTDFTYPLWGAEIAKENGIPQYSLLSSSGADHKSMFLYMEIKGKIERAIKDLNFPMYSVFRPGLIANRDNDDRFGEKILKYVPFIPKVESKDLARAIRLEAEQKHFQFQQNSQPFSLTYENKDILNMLKDKK